MQKRLWGVSAAALALTCLTVTGCGTNNSHTIPPERHGQASKIAYNDNNLNFTQTNSWILPSHLSTSELSSHPWPIYNSVSPLNQFPNKWHGQDSFDDWKIPPKWIPYIYRNQKRKRIADHIQIRNIKKTPLTLYITLQGTVFLYPQTISGTQWLGANSYIADIPPSTIIAEFVPLKAAITAGIIPVSSDEPSGINGFVAPIWNKVLRMSTSQIYKSVQ